MLSVVSSRAGLTGADVAQMLFLPRELMRASRSNSLNAGSSLKVQFLVFYRLSFHLQTTNSVGVQTQIGLYYMIHSGVGKTRFVIYGINAMGSKSLFKV